MNFRRILVLFVVFPMICGMTAPAMAENTGLDIIEAAVTEKSSAVEASIPEEMASTTYAPLETVEPEASAIPTTEIPEELSADPASTPDSEAGLADISASPCVDPVEKPSSISTPEPSPAPSFETAADLTNSPSPNPESTIEASADPIVAPSAGAPAEPAINPLPVQAILPDTDMILLGLKEKINLPGYSLLPEGAVDTVEYMVEGSGLAFTKDGKLLAEKTGSYSLILTAGSGVSVEIPVTVLPAPEKISLSSDRSSLCVGESLSCAATLPEGSAGSFTISTSKPELLRDNGDGSFTAIASGSARINARSYNGKTAYISIRIYPAPTSLSLSRSSLTLAQGEVFSLETTQSKNSCCAIAFSSSDPTIAAVDENGSVTALRTGEVRILAQSCNGLRAECSVTVLPVPENLLLNTERNTLGVKETVSLRPQFLPEGSGGSLRFSSSKPKVAQVDANGCVTALSTGRTVISASTSGGLTASVEITVKKAPASLSLSVESNRFGLGECFGCYPVFSSNASGGILFEISDPSILRHDGGFSFTPVGLGTAIIHAESYNGKTAELTIEVAAAPESITLNTDSCVLGKGDSFDLIPVLSAGSASVIRYFSSDPSVASVDKNGRILALKPGEIVITVETFNGLSATCAVSVRPAPEKLIVEIDRKKIGAHESLPLRVTLLPEGSAASLSYSVDNPREASVSTDGVVTGLRDSRPVITVKTHNGLKASLSINVEDEPDFIRLVPSTATPAVGETFTMETLLVPDDSAGAISLSIDRPDLLELHPDGSLTALAPGTATLIATTYNGITSRIAIRVSSLPDQISLPEGMRMGLGTDDRICATLPEGSGSIIVYESLNPEIISASADGKLHAEALGSAVIRATAANSGVSAECTVHVLPLPERMTLHEKSITLMAGQSTSVGCSFYPEDSFSILRCAASRSDIIDVDENGRLTALREGDTRITVRTVNGLKAYMKVSVLDAPRAIQLSDSALNLKSGDTHVLNYRLSGGSETIVSFSSSNPAVADVDPVSGCVTALATGSAIIRADTLNGLSAGCLVNVNLDAPPENTQEDGLKVTFMNIGRNDGILISCGGEHAFIDSGSYYRGIQAVDYLRSLGITHLKYYIGTHAHTDHIAGAGPIIESLDVDMIIAPHDYVLDVIRHFCKTEEERAAVKTTPSHVLTPGEQLYLGGASITSLGPINYIRYGFSSGDENDNSLVFRLCYGSSSFLLTGDASNKEMQEIAEAFPGSLLTDVFKNPHHDNVLSNDVLDKVLPKIVVFSTSSSYRPIESYLDKFREKGSEIYITSSVDHGYVTVLSDGNKLRVETSSHPQNPV